MALALVGHHTWAVQVASGTGRFSGRADYAGANRSHCHSDVGWPGDGCRSRGALRQPRRRRPPRRVWRLGSCSRLRRGLRPGRGAVRAVGGHRVGRCGGDRTRQHPSCNSRPFAGHHGKSKRQPAPPGASRSAGSAVGQRRDRSAERSASLSDRAASPGRFPGMRRLSRRSTFQQPGSRPPPLACQVGLAPAQGWLTAVDEAVNP